MVSRFAACCAVVLAAATTFASAASGDGVRMDVLSATPRPPQAGKPFELVARVEFAPAPGSLRSTVFIGGKRFRNMRLTWSDSIARCTFVVPSSAHGKRLIVGLSALLGGSHSRTTLAFTVS
jgi:hypothetical protein